MSTTYYCNGCKQHGALWVYTCETCKGEHCDKCSNIPQSLDPAFIHQNCKPTTEDE